VGDARSELTERGELLCLHKAVQGGLQILQRSGEFAGPRLDAAVYRRRDLFVGSKPLDGLNYIYRPPEADITLDRAAAMTTARRVEAHARRQSN
jgi:hypothetical protein